MATRNKSFRPQFWDTVYISEVNGVRKVKSDAQVGYMNKNSDPVQKFFLSLRDGWGDSAPTQFFSNSGNVRLRPTIGIF